MQKKTLILTKFKVTNEKKNETFHVSSPSEEKALVILSWRKEDCLIETLGEEEVPLSGLAKR